LPLGNPKKVDMGKTFIVSFRKEGYLEAKGVKK